MDYESIRKAILAKLEEDWGSRCETKDTDDFEDLITVGDKEAARCPVCLVYEKFDNFWEYFDVENN